MKSRTQFAFAIIIVIVAIVVLMQMPRLLGFVASGNIESPYGGLNTTPTPPLSPGTVNPEPAPAPVSANQCPTMIDVTGDYSGTSDLLESVRQAGSQAQRLCGDNGKSVEKTQDQEKNDNSKTCTAAHCSFDSKKVSQSCRVDSCTYSVGIGQNPDGTYEFTECTWVAQAVRNGAWGSNAFDMALNGIPNNPQGNAAKCRTVSSPVNHADGWTCTYNGVYNQTTYTCK